MKKCLFVLLGAVLLLGLLSACFGGDTREEPVEIALGETITLDFVELSIERAAWAHDIFPPVIAGLYRYLPGTEGETRLVLFGEIQNLGEEPLSAGAMLSTFSLYGGDTYEGHTVGMMWNTIGLAESSVGAGGTREIAVFASIPDSLVERFTGVQVTLGFDGGFAQRPGADMDTVQYRYVITLEPGDIAAMEEPPPPPVTIAFGERVRLDFVEFTIVDAQWNEEIIPPDTDAGGYRYFPQREGERYLVLRGRVANLSDVRFYVDQMFSEFVFDDELVFHGQTNGVNLDRRGFEEAAVEGGEEREIILFTSLPADLADSFDLGLVIFGFDEGFSDLGGAGGLGELQYRFSIEIA